MWHKDVGMEHLMRLELTREGFLVLLANYYTTRGDQFLFIISTYASVISVDYYMFYPSHRTFSIAFWKMWLDVLTPNRRLVHLNKPIGVLIVIIS